MPSLLIFFFCYCQFMSLLLYQIDFVTKVEFYAKQNYLVSFHKIILSRKSNEIKICALLHEWYLNPILLLNKICSREENPGKLRFFRYSFSYNHFNFSSLVKYFCVNSQCYYFMLAELSSLFNKSNVPVSVRQGNFLQVCNGFMLIILCSDVRNFA